MDCHEEWDIEQEIAAAVHKLVTKMLTKNKVPEDSDYDIRMRLTETFRFWKQEGE